MRRTPNAQRSTQKARGCTRKANSRGVRGDAERSTQEGPNRTDPTANRREVRTRPRHPGEANGRRAIRQRSGRLQARSDPIRLFARRIRSARAAEPRKYATRRCTQRNKPETR
ncbi:hypothetical protein B0H17DRAFT_1077473 [Mycena rosella]|uniref:Uncharacterized protein n=1 Tax=Mycena rosella TaxID=1033263 RepID=A0AAD7GD11_MYCRO|nr:hypothetical protein B0H17DRAFT_1077473 [Mycena rosella]